MDLTTSSNVTDDQELAKVLEGMNQAAPDATATPPTDQAADAPSEDAAASDGMSFEPSPVPSTPDVPAAETPVSADLPPVAPVDPAATSVMPGASASPELEAIKKTALEELRPLVDKLDLPANEKFDTLLLLIRSTDDKSLVNAAHEAARAIPDEAKRAQALLDVIKEIDYFSGTGQQPQ